MPNAYSAAQVREAERPSLEAGEPLMARAAAGLAAEARIVLKGQRLGREDDRPAFALILAGPGSNGGDALYAGALLAAGGVRVVVVPTSETLHSGGRAAAEAAGCMIEPAPVDPEHAAMLASYGDLVIDAIAGLGSTPGLRGHARDLVDAIRPFAEALDGPAVIAVDLPSGIGVDDGVVVGPVLPADVTVTFGAYKAGLFLPPAADLAGEVRLVDIGIGAALEGVEPLLRLP